MTGRERVHVWQCTRCGRWGSAETDERAQLQQYRHIALHHTADATRYNVIVRLLVLVTALAVAVALLG